MRRGTLILLENLDFGYDEQHMIFTGLNIELPRDLFSCITGPNGSGKTTLGRLASGILTPCRGRVLIDGEDSRDMSLGEIGKKIGFLFQEPDRQLFAPTVAEELSFVMELAGEEHEIIDDRVEEMLTLFELKGLRKRFPFKLSRGEKQRLALAAVLINRPQYLILDEPLTGLDIKRREKLMEILDRLRCRGVGMAVISHERSFFEESSEQLIKLEGGGVTVERA